MIAPTLRHARGFSLLELMIALVLATLVIAAIAGVFLSVQATLRLAEASARLQENARAVAAMVTRDVRAAGAFGCAGARHHVTIAAPPAALAPFDDGTARWPLPSTYFFSAHDCDADGDCMPVLPASLHLPAAAVSPGRRVPGTDVIVARRLVGDGAPLAVAMADARAPVRVGAAPGWTALEAGDVLIIADCRGADWFVASGVSGAGIAHGAPSNRDDAFGHAYGRDGDARVFRLVDDVETAAYFLAYATSPEDDSALLPALRRTDGASAEELVQGVDDLQATLVVARGAGFATLSPGRVDALGAWADVRRVELRFVVDSVIATNARAESFQFDGAARDPATLAAGADRRLHREVIVPIALRERVR